MGHTDKWLVGASVISGDTNVLVYERSGDDTKLQGKYSGFGARDTGYLGHANDMCILKEDDKTLWVGASHLYHNGIPIVRLDLSSKTGAKSGYIKLKASDGTTDDKLLVSSTQVIEGNKLIVSANNRYWVGTYNPNSIDTNQEVLITPISLNTQTDSAYTAVVGEFNKALRRGQSNWIVDNKIYKTYSINQDVFAGMTISIVIEMLINSPTERPSMTGRYWAMYDEGATNLEFEKCWVENGKLKVNLIWHKADTLVNMTGTLGVL